ncbi:MAG: dihydrodipicolinate synthase family protein, partial [Planctomycetota bacterium]|nr:dihydrodipicolinate synthase family protein [Planctomycetota bacterium]
MTAHALLHSDPGTAPRARELRGLMPACVTPFREDESLDLGAFRALVEHYIASGVDGLVVAGTTGEAHALDLAEREALFRAAVEQAAGRVPVVAGAGASTTRMAKQYVALAAACGCDAAMLLTTWFEKPTHGALLSYYTEAAREARLPLLLYHNPSRTGYDWPVASIAEIARALGGACVGIKDSANDPERAARLRAACPEGFAIFSGGPHLREAFKAAGASGHIDGPCNILPQESVLTYRGDASKLDLLAKVQACCERSKNFIGLAKAAMRALGLPAGHCRR